MLITKFRSICAYISASILMDTDLDLDPYSYLKDNTIVENDTLKHTGFEIYQLLMVIGIIGMMLSLITCGIMLMLARKGSKLEESKHRIMGTVIIGFVIFAFPFFLGVVMKMANSLL